jgi:hypothetical protein
MKRDWSVAWLARVLFIVSLLLIQGCSCGTSATSESGDVYFPQLRPVAGDRGGMDGDITGELVLVDGCIRLNPRYGDVSYLVVWPPEYTLVAEDDLLQVRNENGDIVARVGEGVYMGGGEMPESSAQWLSQELLSEELREVCSGPYWVIGEGVRLLEDWENN